MKNLYYNFIIFTPLIAIFLPEYLLMIFGIASLLMLSFNYKLMFKVIKYKYNYLLLVFSIFLIIQSLIFNNTIGTLASLIFFLITNYLMFLRYIINEKIFEIMGYIIGLGSLLSIYFTTIDFHQSISYKIIAIFEKYLHHSYDLGESFTYRFRSTFFHPNFYGYIIITVILFSIYKIFVYLKNIKYKYNKYNIIFYCLILLANICVINLPQSKAIYLALLVGIITLFVAYNHKLLLVVLPSIALIIFNLDTLINKIPRIETFIDSLNVRMDIWNTAFKIFIDNPLFGRGLYTYLDQATTYGGQVTIHSHNIFLDSLVNFGTIGTIYILFLTIVFLYPHLKEWLDQHHQYVPLVLSLICMTLIHGYSDVVLMCPQTFILFCVLYASLEVKNGKTY